MDFFVLFLLILSLGTVALLTLSFRYFPLVQATFEATNRLTSTVALSATLNFDSFHYPTTGGTVANVVIGADTVSDLPSRWVRDVTLTCIDRDLLLGMFITSMTVASIHCVVVAILVWATPSYGDAHDMRRRVTRLANERPHSLEDQQYIESKQRTLVKMLDRQLWIGGRAQRITILTSTLVMSLTCATCALIFLSRSCVEKELSAEFRKETYRTRYWYTAESYSWPAFLFLFSSVASFMVLVATAQWVLFEQCGPQMFETMQDIITQGADQRATSSSPAVLLKQMSTASTIW